MTVTTREGVAQGEALPGADVDSLANEPPIQSLEDQPPPQSQAPPPDPAASPAPEHKPEPPPLTPRAAVLAQIAAARASEAAPQPSDPDDDGPAPPPVAPAAAAPAQEPPKPQGAMVRVIVDGREVVVPASQVRMPVKINGREVEVSGEVAARDYQQAAASQEVFRQAKALHDQATAARGGDQPPIAPPAPQLQPTAPAPLVAPDEIRKIVEDIQFGDADKGAQALAGLIDKITQATPKGAPDLDRLASDVTEQVKRTLTYEGALARVGQEFQDVFSDPRTTSLAAQYVHQIRARDANQGVSRSDYEVFADACREVQGWVASLKGTPSPSTPITRAQPVGMAQRLAVKAALPSTPRTASGRASLPAEPPPLTAAQVIAEKRNRRGLAA